MRGVVHEIVLFSFYSRAESGKSKRGTQKTSSDHIAASISDIRSEELD